MQKQFTKIGYGLSSTETEIKKNKLLDRKELLTPKVTQTGQVLQLTVTYNHTLPNVKQVIQNHWSILNTNKALERAFSIQPIIAFCKNKRLKQLIEGNTIQNNRNIKKLITNLKWIVHLVGLEFGDYVVYRYKTHIHFVANKMEGYFSIFCKVNYLL